MELWLEKIEFYVNIGTTSRESIHVKTYTSITKIILREKTRRRKRKKKKGIDCHGESATALTLRLPRLVL